MLKLPGRLRMESAQMAQRRQHCIANARILRHDLKFDVGLGRFLFVGKQESI